MSLINNFKPGGGFHCLSCSIRQVLEFYGVDVSEEMIFGLSSALNFFYIENKRCEYPLIGGRVRRAEFEDNFMVASGIALQAFETTSRKRAYLTLYEEIYRGTPCMAYVDVALLPYVKLPEKIHFGGHAIVVFGIDEEAGVAYISDRECEGSRNGKFDAISLDILAEARDSRTPPFPPANRVVKFSTGRYNGITAGAIQSAIKKNSKTMLYPPIRCLGLPSIQLFAAKVPSWKDMSDATLRSVAYNAQLMINMLDGSGGGCFRKKYGEFLATASEWLGSRELRNCGRRYGEAAEIWDEVCELLLQIYEGLNRNHLLTISSKLHKLHKLETEIQTSIFDIVGNDD